MTANRKKILIIDDDETHLLTSKELLENEGYEVMIHNLPFGSTNLIKERRPDLVLLDVNMPGLSGDRLSRIIMSNDKTKHIPVVFYSSNDEDSLRRSVVAHGVRGYICKGSVFDLRKKVAYYLGRNTEGRP